MKWESPGSSTHQLLVPHNQNYFDIMIYDGSTIHIHSHPWTIVTTGALTCINHSNHWDASLDVPWCPLRRRTAELRCRSSPGRCDPPGTAGSPRGRCPHPGPCGSPWRAPATEVNSCGARELRRTGTLKVSAMRSRWDANPPKKVGLLVMCSPLIVENHG